MSPAVCPNCGRSLPESERQEGWCEGCGKRLPGAVPGGSFTRAPAGRAEAPRPAPPRPAVGDPLAWGSVRTGLTLVLVGTGLLLPGLLGLVYADVLWGSELGRARADGPDLMLRRSLQT